DKFYRDPEGGLQRRYRTGDLGRFLSDGFLEYIGRKDFEVKIGGNRIQIAEIELALAAVPSIKEVHVIARQNARSEPQLVAYYRVKGTADPKHFELRRFLRNRLPVVMVPSVFVKIEEFPLTGSGKLDCNALPTPSTARPDLPTEYVGPATPVERLLASIWTEVLSIGQVGIHDNFFDLGGHSLAATRVISRVTKQFRLELPLQSLFQSPTVAEMAAIITQNQARGVSDAELTQMLREAEAMTEDEAQRCAKEIDD
ncbi:MAG: phosphopantetheine-binding protein, partial [Candidatus Binatia bacterium]